MRRGLWRSIVGALKGRRLCALGLLCILPLLAIAHYLFNPPFPAGLTLARGDLRLSTWLSVTWSQSPTEPERVRQLAGELEALRVDDVYVYVSYLKLDDTFNPTYDHAPEFVAALRREAPGARLLAWIGVPVAGAVGAPPNRLASTGIRRRIAEFSRFATDGLGFDGVHLNAELVADGDAGFLDTLSAVREALPEGAFLSATAHPLRLAEAVTVMPYPAVAHHWSLPYLRRVAERVDQIVVMAYDSGLLFPRDYLNWMRYQVARGQEALRGVAAELAVGFSVSEEWTLSHQTQAETLSAALGGIAAGLSERLDGIAIYPFWEADAGERQRVLSSLGR